MEASGCRIIRYGKKEAEFSVYDVADIHWLNRGISKHHLYQDIERIKKDPYALFFQGGDYGEWIFPGDPRLDWEAFDKDLKVVDLAYLGFLISKAMIDIFSPVKEKCLGFCIGNHEFTAITRNSQARVHDEICKKLGVPNMRFSGFTDVYFVYEKGAKSPLVTLSDKPPKKFVSRLRCFIHHGMGAANTAGGKINKLKSLVDMVDADLVMMGHVHEQFAKAFLKLSPNQDCSKIGQKVTMGMITGSYLRTYAPDFTGYGEIRGYSPTTLGATRARYIPGERILTVENRADEVGLKGDL
jgi:hypothetical protein